MDKDNGGDDTEDASLSLALSFCDLIKQWTVLGVFASNRASVNMMRHVTSSRVEFQAIFQSGLLRMWCRDIVLIADNMSGRDAKVQSHDEKVQSHERGQHGSKRRDEPTATAMRSMDHHVVQFLEHACKILHPNRPVLRPPPLPSSITGKRREHYDPCTMSTYSLSRLTQTTFI